MWMFIGEVGISIIYFVVVGFGFLNGFLVFRRIDLVLRFLGVYMEFLGLFYFFFIGGDYEGIYRL